MSTRVTTKYTLSATLTSTASWTARRSRRSTRYRVYGCSKSKPFFDAQRLPRQHLDVFDADAHHQPCLRCAWAELPRLSQVATLASRLAAHRLELDANKDWLRWLRDTPICLGRKARQDPRSHRVEQDADASQPQYIADMHKNQKTERLKQPDSKIQLLLETSNHSQTRKNASRPHPHP
jgi:hypothetical protein